MRSEAKWIWESSNRQPLNQHVCFRKSFWLEDIEHERKTLNAELQISADSRYEVYVNGVKVGMGPIRSMPGRWYYDIHAVGHLLCQGQNTIAVKVWHFGQSNYQYIENQAGLIAALEVRSVSDEVRSVLILTDETWKASVHEGYKCNTVKRNVNLGWMEVYDSNLGSELWRDIAFEDGNWSPAVIVGEYGSAPWGLLHDRDIPYLAEQTVYPQQLVALSEVLPLKQAISLSMRENFFPERRDANASIFSGYVAVNLSCTQAIRGRISFPHIKWNAVYGDFRIDGHWYRIDPLNRVVDVELACGVHFFMMEICAIHDDLFAHIEFDFPEELIFSHPFQVKTEAGTGGIDEAASALPAFVTIGPIETLSPVADGYQLVYGGLEDDIGLNREHPLFKQLGECTSGAELAIFQQHVKELPVDRIYVGEHIFSLMSRKKVLRKHPIQAGLESMLQSHAHPTLIDMPVFGGDMELIVDLGRIYVGHLEIDVEAAAGTVIDLYGFESMPQGKIEYTEGLNNSVRYICREGRQSYTFNSRMGMRYVMVTLRKQAGPVAIYSLRMHWQSYPVTRQGSFRSSDALLNDIWDISEHTHHLCMEDTFVDCPSYEQTYWIGDANTSALVNYYLFGSYALIKHCLRLVPASREQSPLIPALMPTDWQTSIPFWTFNWIISVYQYIAYTGDRSILEELYPEIKQTLATYEAFIREDGLFDISSWNLLDWADLDIANQGVVTAQQGLLAYCYKVMAEMAGMQELAADAERFTELRTVLLNALKLHLWDEAEQAFIDGISRKDGRSTTRSMQTHVLLYTHDALDEETMAAVDAHLLNPPANWVEAGSPFMSFYLFECWHRVGLTERILASVRKEWGMMVRHGSTTCWETFPGFYKTRLTRSYAHGWSVGPALLFGKFLLGVRMDGEGYSKIAVCPPDVDLDWVEGSLPTPFGRIDTAWSKENGQKKMRITVPVEIEVLLDEMAGGWTVEIERVGE